MSSGTSHNVLQRIWFRARIFISRKTKTHVGVLLLALFFLAVLLYRSMIRVDQPYSLPVETSCQDHHHDDGERRPKPLIVLIAGGGRSGTTYLYNLIRILLRQRDPNTISGWYEDLAYAARYASPPLVVVDAQQEGLLDSFQTTGTTLLIKVHSLGHATSLFSGCTQERFPSKEDCLVDYVFLTHRDLGPQVNSLRRMGWARWKTLRQVLASSFCFNVNRKLSPRLTNQDWLLPETWTIQATALAVCHSAWKMTAGPKLALDVGMEMLVGDKEKRVALANAIIRKIDGDKSKTMNTTAAVTEADALRPLDCASHLAVNPVTHLHRGHVASSSLTSEDNTQDDESKQRGYDAIAADANLKQWRRAHGYVQ